MMREDMTFEQMNRMIELVRFAYETHLSHCRLCIPGRWLCPEADQFYNSITYWVKRLVTIKQASEVRES